MARAKRSSTERGAGSDGPDELSRRLPTAMELSIVDGTAAVPQLAAEWGLGRSARLGAIAAKMADPAEVHERLERASGLGLVALEILVEAGGLLWRGELHDVWQKRAGAPPRAGGRDSTDGAVEPAAMAAALEQLERLGLIVAVQVNSPVTRGPRPAVALLDVNGLIVADAVYGVTLPSRPMEASWSSTEAPSPPPEFARLVAVATMVAHHGVRATKDGWVHRGSIKKHARRLEMAPELLEDLLEGASRCGAVRADAGRFWVDLDGLDRVVRGQVPAGGEQLVEWLRRDGAVSREELVRRLASARRAPLGLFQRSLTQELDEAARDVDDLAPALTVEVDGVRWCRLVELAGLPDAAVEGFVTPGLDVMVGPDPDPRVVAQVGLGAELVRLDRVITFRLRPKTVADLVAVGGDPARLIEALDKVGKHGLPDSVRAQIADWASAAKVAVARSVVLVRTSERHHDALAKVLAARSLGSPRPGEVLLSTDDYRALRAELASAGFDLTDAQVHDPPPAAVADDADALLDEGEEPRLPLAAPLAALRERVQRERADGFAESLPPMFRPDALFPSASARRARLREETPSDFPPVAQRAVAAMLDLHEGLAPRLEQWAESLPAEHRLTAQYHVRDPVLCLSLLALAPRRREQLLAKKRRTPLETLSKAAELVHAHKVSPRGRRVLKGLGNRTFVDWINRLVNERADAIEAMGLSGEASGSGPEPDPAAPQLALPYSSPAEYRVLLQAARAARAPLSLSWRSSEGVRREDVRIDEITERGGRTLVLVTEQRTERGRAIHLDDIVGVGTIDSSDAAQRDS